MESLIYLATKEQALLLQIEENLVAANSVT